MYQCKATITLIATFSFGAIHGQSAPALPRIRLIDLGEVGNTNADPVINDAGHVAGGAYFNPGQPEHAFVWTEQTGRRVNQQPQSGPKDLRSQI